MEFAVVVLPIVLPLIVTVVPSVLTMPVKPCDTLVVEPDVVIEPITLFEIEIELPLDSLVMPELMPPVVEIVETTDPVPVPLPIVLPLVVPMFALPADR